MKIFLQNLGCDKNRVDGEKLLARLVAAGFTSVPAPGRAELVIVNTCGFIRAAKEESIEAILGHAKSAKVAVTGCFSERYGDTLRRKLAEADLVAGLSDKESTFSALLKRYGGGMAAAPCLPHDRVMTGPAHTAPLKIAEGCGNRCSYCAIPLIRGPLRPRPPEEILAEARLLRKRGVREAVLVAQDTTAWGKRKGLPGLLKKLCRMDDPFDWVRVMYCHPAGVTPELMETIASEPSIVKYIDMPLQHVSDRVLRRMNRPYDRARVARLLDDLRRFVPGIAVRTTFLLGFPGESRRDFEELYGFAEEARFDRMGVFAYSPEEGTAAFRLKGRPAHSLVTDRIDRLMTLQNEILQQKNKSKIGRRFKVLIDSREKDGFHGRTEHDAPEVDCGVIVRRKKLNVGAFYSMKIVSVRGFDLIV